MVKATFAGISCGFVIVAAMTGCSGDSVAPTENIADVSLELKPHVRHGHGSDGGSEQPGGSNSGCKNICTLTVEGDQVVRYINVKEAGLSIEETSTISIASPGGGVTSLEGTVRQGSHKLYSYASSATPDGTGSVEVDWGKQVKGLDELEGQFSGGTLTGTVNDRAFQPFAMDADPASAVFVDGKPDPKSSISSQGLKKQFERLEEEVNDVIEDCELVTTLDADVAPAAVQALAIAGNDTGHPSETYDATGCDVCKGAVYGGAVAAGIACGVACVASFGIACGVCLASGPLAVAAGILACEQSGACCPIACGGGFPGTCCFGDEECLNPDEGLCCSAGQQKCAGEACCRGDESCIDQGVEQGTCCKNEDLCGSLNCCPDGESCFDQGSGKCCADSKVCGESCCGGVEDTLSYCMNAATSTCCSSLQVECGGQCCPQGQGCVDGACTAVDETCELPCTTQADCVGDSHLRCRADEGFPCCVYTPF